MPGKIVKVQIAVGDSVAERDLLIVLEAMKMEHRIEATRDGIVKSIAVTPGSLVAGGATLVELEA
jgi:biotin carboxyl carrier protein